MLDLQAQLSRVNTRTSARGLARQTGLSLSSVQRVLSGAVSPSIRTLTLLGLALNQRLELVPAAHVTSKPRRTPPNLLRGSSQSTRWSNGDWLEEDADYLLALLGQELRHARRRASSGLRSADRVAADLGISTLTVRRMESPGAPWTSLDVAQRVAEAIGYSLIWVPAGDPWRARPWQLERRQRDPRAAMAAARRSHGRHRAAMMTSIQQTWTTPPELIAAVTAEFGPITLDCAAQEGDQVAPEWLGPDHLDPARRDALAFEHWADVTRSETGHACHGFLNPPFSMASQGFVERAIATAAAGMPMTVILPARVDTRVFQDLIFPTADEVRFLRGRIRYGRGDGKRADPAPFPTALIRFARLRRRTTGG